MKNLTYIIVLLIIFNSCLQDEPFKKSYSGFDPVTINDGWAISSPEVENVDRDSLEKAYRLLYSDERFWMARSLIVVRNGKLVAEAYPHNSADRNQFANIQSCTKTFTSIMLGIALQEGVAISINDKLYDIYPELFDGDLSKSGITLKDALTMQTGLEFNNDVNTLQLYQTNMNSARFVLSYPKLHEPGTVMNYNDGAPQLVSKALEIKTGKTVAAYAREKLFEPLNITDWQWECAHDSTTYGAFSLYLKPRDFAKIGQLLLQNGKWDDRQIISHGYLQEATTSKLVSNFSNHAPYGYYFWIDTTNTGFYAHGHGGQILLVVPGKNLVILYTAWPYTSGDYFDNGFEMLNIIVNGCL